MVTCQHCHGVGKRSTPIYHRWRVEYYWFTCRECQGIGRREPDAVEVVRPDELEVARWESEGGR